MTGTTRKRLVVVGFGGSSRSQRESRATQSTGPMISFWP